MPPPDPSPEPIAPAPDEPGAPVRDPELCRFVAAMLERGPVDHFTVRHHVAGYGETRVADLDLQRPAPRTSERLPEEVSEELRTLCEEDAKGHAGGDQFYWVYCFRPGDDERHDSRKPVRVPASPTQMVETMSSTPPTPTGLVDLATRDAQVFARIAADACLSLKRENTAELRLLYDRVRDLERGRDEGYKLLADTLKQQAQLQIDMIHAQQEDRRHQFLYKILDMASGPVMGKVLGRVLGQEAFALTEGPKDPDAVQKLVGSLTMEQRRAAVKILGKPEQIMALQSIVEAVDAGKPIPFGGDTLRKLMRELNTPPERHKFEALMELMRPDQQELFAAVFMPYLAEIDPAVAADLAAHKKAHNGAAAAPSTPPGVTPS